MSSPLWGAESVLGLFPALSFCRLTSQGQARGGRGGLFQAGRPRVPEHVPTSPLTKDIIHASHSNPLVQREKRGRG